MADRGINTPGQQSNRDAKVGAICSQPPFSWAATVSETDRNVVCHATHPTYQEVRMLNLSADADCVLANEAELGAETSIGDSVLSRLSGWRTDVIEWRQINCWGQASSAKSATLCEAKTCSETPSSEMAPPLHSRWQAALQRVTAGAPCTERGHCLG